jgi:glycerol-3-phosphate acyltransferase PlsY
LNFTLIGAVFAAYLVGSVPSGLLLSKLFGKQDPRDHGSGNIGATNVTRTGGRLLGAVTMLADILKGLVPVALAIFAGLSETWIAAIALAVFLGHLFPLYLKFKGGKGVATMLGVMLPWQPVAALAGLGVWALLLRLSHYVSLASILAGLTLPLLIWWTEGSIACLLVSMTFASLVTVKHAANIRRLMDGTEPMTGSKDSEVRS